MTFEENASVATWWCKTCARTVYLRTGDEPACPVCSGRLLELRADDDWDEKGRIR
jgi:Zn finger protein HypA/HybF involved in hydrogenase expression